MSAGTPTYVPAEPDAGPPVEPTPEPVVRLDEFGRVEVVWDEPEREQEMPARGDEE